MQQFTLPWEDPVSLARSVYLLGKDMVFLHSSLSMPFSGRYSYLAFYPDKTLDGKDIEAFKDRLTTTEGRFDNAWFGYMAYELHELLDETKHYNSETASLLRFTQYQVIIVFDHAQQTRTVYCVSAEALSLIPSPMDIDTQGDTVPFCIELSSNMSKEEYISAVESILEDIRNGTYYQANLTRKFFGAFKHRVSAFELFVMLTGQSPSPYSAFMQCGDKSILSSSPEQFLTMQADGMVESRPIKGTAPRGKTPEEDCYFKEQLANSQKDKAENLMIVDLMRNDFSRHAIAGSVNVPSLFDVSQYQTIHHMASTVQARKDPARSPFDFVSACFPPGSMTGAPKLKAIECLAHYEKQCVRGVYSGVLGWFGGDGYVDLSVVIRTLLLQGKRFEFQVGGAIVADSDPEKEWQETLVKASAICKVLRILPEKELAF